MEEVTWTNPHDDKKYYEGDIIPAYVFDNSGALVYGESCVRLADPGFAGVVAVNNGNEIIDVEYSPKIPAEAIIKWLYQPIEPDENVFFVGPESPGWRWFYARRATLSSKAISKGDNEDLIA